MNFPSHAHSLSAQFSSFPFHGHPSSSALMVRLLPAARLPANTQEPIPLEAKRARAITLPRTCLTPELSDQTSVFLCFVLLLFFVSHDLQSDSLMLMSYSNKSTAFMRDPVSVLYFDSVATLLVCTTCTVHRRRIGANAFRLEKEPNLHQRRWNM